MTIAYLDSNIYRQLGLNFADNVDYKNLANILETSGNEFGLLEVVYSELLDYYENDILHSLTFEHEKIVKRWLTNPYLPPEDVPVIKLDMKPVLANIANTLKANKLFSELHLVNPNLLLEFLLNNKRNNRKDNTRDFLILYSIINYCQKNQEDYVVLISQDDIFIKNEYFKALLTRKQIGNFRVFSSITDFIKDFGPKLDFIDEEFVLQFIDQNFIKSQLMENIKCLPSYISNFYFSTKEDDIPELKQLDILKVSVNDFYVVKNYNTEQLNITVSLRVKVSAIFQPERNIKELENYLGAIDESSLSKYSNTFDKEYRPIFDNEILFIIGGKVDEEQKIISELYHIDFIPDYFILDELKSKINNNIAETKLSICKHEVDIDNGYWKNSRYGGGLSWHYRCKKCMIEFDSGDFFD
ncbi:PIN domain-containing protein [Flavobacterium sp.]|uniref:PIN domain-containing protein n=1 Tax=Flavobacterium sp. TaxID=239 RepID=UPI004033AC64